MKRMIDEPNEFETLKVWKKHLSMLQELKKPDENVNLAINRAKQIIAKLTQSE